MGLGSRLVSAVRAGVQAFRDESGIPAREYPWDDYSARLERYGLYQSYYHNIAYTRLQTYAAAYETRRKLYKHIRSIYNPVERLIDFYVANVYGGSIDMENFTTGAVPIVGGDERLREAIRQFFIWSNWNKEKTLFTRNPALYGDGFTKLVDEPDKGKVRAEILPPSYIKELTVDAVGNVKAVTIEYERDAPAPPARFGLPPQKALKTTLYTEKIDGEQFQYFKDGEPWDYVNDEPNGAFAAYANPYGFVPMTHTVHKDMGLVYGANAFYGQIGKIDELNDSASHVNDQIRKAINPLWYFAGVSRSSEIDASVTERDQLPALYGPKDSQPFPMVFNIDIAGALANIDRQLAELSRDKPELALEEIRRSGNLTAPGVRAAYTDAIGKVNEARANYDDSLVRLIQMAVSIGAMRGYRGFEAFDAGSYDRGELEFTIGERPVIEDTLSTKEKIDALQAAGAPLTLILRELGYAQEVIDEVTTTVEARARMEAGAALQSLLVGDEEDEGDDAATDAPPTAAITTVNP